MASPTTRTTRGPAAGTRSGGAAWRFGRTLKDARAGILEAQYQVGLMYANGAGVAPDLAQAVDWIRRAAERGHVGAQYMLGTHYGADQGVAPAGQIDETQAMDWLYRAARQGHARAHHRLARLIAQSHRALASAYEATAASLGVPESQLALGQLALHAVDDGQRHSGALAWLRRAAEQGLPAAQTEFGKALLQGRCGAADRDEGLRWLRAAAAGRWPPAIVALHDLGEAGSSPADAASPPPDPMDAQARHDLGRIWELGIAGLGPDHQQAAHWYGLAAEQGQAQAHTALARLAEPLDATGALAHYRAAAQAGDADAQAALGRLLDQPSCTVEQRLEGRGWRMRAAQAGQPEALLALAAQWREHDPALAAEATRRAAEAGLAEAQFQHAAALTGGQGGQGGPGGPEVPEALEWYRRAAEQGHAGALCAIGLAHRNGHGLPRDPDAAARYFQAAADRGHAPGRWNLALMIAAGSEAMPRDLPAAMAACREAADAGFVPAQATMGVLCAAVGRPDEAVHWWRQAAERGDAEAQFNLAQALATGRGAPADAKAAFDWFLRAAESGLVVAQARLGILYATGEGVAADPIEAHKWFFVARLAGDTAATSNLQRSRELLAADARDEGERRARAWRAAH
jgi:hypothetical protein